VFKFTFIYIEVNFKVCLWYWSQSRILDDGDDYGCLGEWMQRFWLFQDRHSDFVWFLPTKYSAGSDDLMQ